MLALDTVTRITALLNQQGDGRAKAEHLLPLVYEELRRLAAEKMTREVGGHTLQATALVHEAWLRVGGNDQSWENRSHFFGAAAEAMRRILVEHARSRRALRHGGGFGRVNIDDVEIAGPPADDELLMVHTALDVLAAKYPQKALLVKLRYFAGLTMPEIAEILEISVPTAERQWAFARAWLKREIGNQY